MVNSPRMISITKIIPAKGALKVAAMPAAAPHPTKTRIRSLESFIIWPNIEPITEQICTVGPTRPADPPDPIVMEEVRAQTANVRLRIFPFFRTTASMTRSTPFSATASGKYPCKKIDHPAEYGGGGAGENSNHGGHDEQVVFLAEKFFDFCWYYVGWLIHRLRKKGSVTISL